MPAGAFRHLTTGRSLDLSIGQGRPVLLNLWASWCEPCVLELADLARRESELAAAGLDVVALCVDELDEKSQAPGAAADLIKRLEVPFQAGHASREIVGDLQAIHDNFILMARPLPVPSSFLIDEEGRVAMMYKGPVTVDQVIADAKRSPESPMERFRRAAPLAGSAIDHDLTAATLRLSETAARMRLARNWLAVGRYAEAISEFGDLVAAAPDSSPAHYGLGEAYLKQGQLDAAIAEFRAAIRLSESSAQAHFRVALALEKQGSVAEAIAHYRRGLELDPSFLEGANNLAWLLATNDEPSSDEQGEALRWAQKCAAATEYANPGILDSLAAACANADRFPDAVRWQRAALRLAPPAAHPAYRARLALYEANKPYRRPSRAAESD
jgi:Tfp pilus assembly protein PilF/peroxiredoxin